MSKDLNAITNTIYNEARNQGIEGMEAVGATIQNRVDANKSYLGGHDYQKVCEKGYEGYKINKDHDIDPSKLNSMDSKAYKEAQRIAQDVIDHKVIDRTNGSTHFDASKHSFDKYGDKIQYTKTIGAHYFFKEIFPEQKKK